MEKHFIQLHDQRAEGLKLWTSYRAAPPSSKKESDRSPIRSWPGMPCHRFARFVASDGRLFPAARMAERGQKARDGWMDGWSGE